MSNNTYILVEYYKGFAIHYNRDSNAWAVMGVSHNSLNEVEDYIDANISPINESVIYIGRGFSENEAVTGTLSETENLLRFNGRDFIFTSNEGNSRPVKASEIVPDTLENRKIIEKIRELTDQMYDLSARSRELEQGLQQANINIVKSWKTKKPRVVKDLSIFVERLKP